MTLYVVYVVLFYRLGLVGLGWARLGWVLGLCGLVGFVLPNLSNLLYITKYVEIMIVGVGIWINMVSNRKGRLGWVRLG